MTTDVVMMDRYAQAFASDTFGGRHRWALATLAGRFVRMYLLSAGRKYKK